MTKARRILLDGELLEKTRALTESTLSLPFSTETVTDIGLIVAGQIAKEHILPEFLQAMNALLDENVSQVNLIRFLRGQKGSLKRDHPGLFTEAFIRCAAGHSTVWMILDHPKEVRPFEYKFRSGNHYLAPCMFKFVRSRKELYEMKYRRGVHLVNQKEYGLSEVLSKGDNRDLNTLYTAQFDDARPKVSLSHFLYTGEIKGHHVIVIRNPLKGNTWTEKTFLNEIQEFLQFIEGMKRDFRPGRYGSPEMLDDMIGVIKIMRTVILNGNTQLSYESDHCSRRVLHEFKNAIRRRINDIQRENIRRYEKYDQIPKSLLKALTLFLSPSRKLQVVGNCLIITAQFMSSKNIEGDSTVITWFDSAYKSKQISIDALREMTGIDDVKVYTVRFIEGNPGFWVMESGGIS